MKFEQLWISVLASVLAGCGAGDTGADGAPPAGAALAEAPVVAWHDADLLPLPRPEGERQVGVRLSEYSIEMTRERVPAGEVEFHVVNAGTTIHYLVVRSPTAYAMSRHLPPGDTTVMRVNLEPGEYQYLCTIRDEFDHYSEGMNGNIIIY